MALKHTHPGVMASDRVVPGHEAFLQLFLAVVLVELDASVGGPVQCANVGLLEKNSRTSDYEEELYANWKTFHENIQVLARESGEGSLPRY